MGSENDKPLMQPACEVLTRFRVKHEMIVASAHRTPDRVAQLASEAAKKGIGVIIAGAGMAAHLAGAVAARTTLPVIGVPLASGSLNGLDALLATVQMPSGVPVATVAVNGAKNAAYLAVQILALSDKKLAQALSAEKAVK